MIADSGTKKANVMYLIFVTGEKGRKGVGRKGVRRRGRTDVTCLLMRDPLRSSQVSHC